MRNGTTTKVGRKVTTALLALAMALGGVLASAPVALAYDDPFVKTADNTSLSTSAITVSDQWSMKSGSYVYYGNESLKYRVLDNGTTKFNEEGSADKTMLLDCDSVPFNNTPYASDNNAWATSNVKKVLNGGEGVETPFISLALTPQEQRALTESYTNNGVGPDSATAMKNFNLTGEKVFVLSVGEVDTYYAKNDNMITPKTGGYWWLRSAGYYEHFAALVDGGGYVDSNGLPVGLGAFGVSPAFNVNLSSVIFSSKISDEKKEYKLTLQDSSTESPLG